MERSTLAFPKDLEGFWRASPKHINTTHHRLATGTLDPIFISGNNSLVLGGESHLSMSTSLPAV